MTDDLKLPTEISGNGQELWDWAARVSQATQRAQRCRELRGSIANLRSQCGSCKLWMTTRCPRETLSPTGRKLGPSMSDTKCSKFDMKAVYVKLADEQTAELEELAKR